MVRKNWPEILASIKGSPYHPFYYPDRPVILMLLPLEPMAEKWPRYATKEPINPVPLSAMRKRAEATARRKGKKARGQLVTFGATKDMPVFCFSGNGCVNPDKGVYEILEELKGADELGSVYMARTTPLVLVQKNADRSWFVPAEYIDTNT